MDVVRDKVYFHIRVGVVIPEEFLPIDVLSSLANLFLGATF
jgi:hypothetical protein